MGEVPPIIGSPENFDRPMQDAPEPHAGDDASSMAWSDATGPAARPALGRGGAAQDRTDPAGAVRVAPELLRALTGLWGDQPVPQERAPEHLSGHPSNPVATAVPDAPLPPPHTPAETVEPPPATVPPATAQAEAPPPEAPPPDTSTIEAPVAAEERIVPADFVESAYLRAFPDVQMAVEAGHCPSARTHCAEHGGAEGRLRSIAYQAALAEDETGFFPDHSVDEVLVTEAGFAFVIGWIDDDVAVLDRIRLVEGGRLLGWCASAMRQQRRDVEARLGLGAGRRVGFWAVLPIAPVAADAGQVVVSLGAGPYRCRTAAPRTLVSLRHLRRRFVGRLAHARAEGASIHEIGLHLEGELASVLGAINAEIARQAASGAFCSRFAPDPQAVPKAGPDAASEPASRTRDGGTRPFETSVIVPVRQPEMVFVQSALFRLTPARAAELVFVIDDPAILEQVLREAEFSAQIYGVPTKVVSLPDRVGGGAALNAAARFAEGARLVFIDQSVLPERADWLDIHDAVLRDQPAAQAGILGAFLRESGGAAGWREVEITVEAGAATAFAQSRAVRLLRITHADRRRNVRPAEPGHATAVPGPRPTVALAGNFVSVARATFDRLGGFDATCWSRPVAVADLSLRASEIGIETWKHRLPLARLDQAVGAPSAEDDALLLIDRSTLTTQWIDLIERRAEQARAANAARPAAEPIPAPKPAPPADADAPAQALAANKPQAARDANPDRPAHARPTRTLPGRGAKSAQPRFAAPDRPADAAIFPAARTSRSAPFDASARKS